MNAAEVLKAAKVAGIRVTAEGDDLVLNADAPPPAPILNALKRHKTEIVALLAASAEEWAAQDWQAFFDERAGIAEFEGGLSRTDAETRAFECCVVEWLNRNPEPSEPGRCAECGKTGVAGCAVIPFGTEIQGHTWLHPQCWSAWLQKRHERAKGCLGSMVLFGPLP
jgi:hypothetical protein